MKKILNLLVCLCAITFSSIAQNSDFAKENTSKKEGNQRRIDRLLKEADSAFFYEYYFHAVGLYKNALQQGPAKNKLPKIYLKVATAQNRMNYPLDALPYLDFLWDENFYDREFLMLYGDVLLKCANYQKADIVFSLLYEQDSSNILVLNKLKSCQLGMNFKDEDMAFPSKKLIRQEKIQSNFSEYGLAFVNDQLIFSSTKVTSPKRIDSRTGQGFSHLYISPSFDRFNLQWNESRLLSENISSPDLNDGVFSYDESNKIGYFSRYTDGKWVIYTTKYNDDGTWAAPLPFIINKMDDNITHPAISPNGRHLIFAARAESGQGGADLWMTTYIAEPKTSAPAKKRTTKTTTPKKTPKKNASTKKTKVVEPQNKDWNIPVNLGSIINTSGNELFATWLNDNTIVYSSDGLPGYGGLDMYYSTMDSAGNFSEPLLLPPPINSSFDDYNMVIDKKINHGFFVSNRYTGPFYSDDIYAFPKSEGNIELNGLIVDNATGDPVPFSVVNITAPPIVDSSITT